MHLINEVEKIYKKVSPLIEERKVKQKKSTRIFYFANKSGGYRFSSNSIYLERLLEEMTIFFTSSGIMTRKVVFLAFKKLL